MFDFIIETPFYFYSLLISTTSIILIYFLLVKNNLLIELPSKNNRKIHIKKITRIGGLSILSFAIILFYSSNDTEIKILISLSLLIFLAGFIEDITKNVSYKIRFLILISTVLVLTVSYDEFVVNFTHVELLDNDFAKALLIIFSLLGILFCINGSNFIDGMNGLTLGTSIIIFINFSYYSFNSLENVFLLSTILIFSILPLFLINIIYGEIFTGDGGSYILGFLYGCLGIMLFNNNLIEAFHVACILFYPTTELIFTFFRRIYNRKNPFKPDRYHLHIMAFNLIVALFERNKIKIKKTTINSLTSFLFLSILSLLNFILLYFESNFEYLVSYIFLNILYLIVYFLIRRQFSKILI